MMPTRMTLQLYAMTRYLPARRHRQIQSLQHREAEQYPFRLTRPPVHLALARQSG